MKTLNIADVTLAATTAGVSVHAFEQTARGCRVYGVFDTKPVTVIYHKARGGGRATVLTPGYAEYFRRNGKKTELRDEIRETLADLEVM